jgi:hypothetical protein
MTTLLERFCTVLDDETCAVVPGVVFGCDNTFDVVILGDVLEDGTLTPVCPAAVTVLGSTFIPIPGFDIVSAPPFAGTA